MGKAPLGNELAREVGKRRSTTSLWRRRSDLSVTGETTGGGQGRALTGTSSAGGRGRARGGAAPICQREDGSTKRIGRPGRSGGRVWSRTSRWVDAGGERRRQRLEGRWGQTPSLPPKPSRPRDRPSRGRREKRFSPNITKCRAPTQDIRERAPQAKVQHLNIRPEYT